jgi:sodium/hydrogen exchanger-like protein 6/7
MPIHLGSPIIVAAAPDSSAPTPIPEEEEFYSSWSLFLVCLLLILSLWTSYYLQIKRIRAIHDTVISIVAGMVVGFIVRIAPGHLIREMLVSHPSPRLLRLPFSFLFFSFADDACFCFVIGEPVAKLE